MDLEWLDLFEISVFFIIFVGVLHSGIETYICHKKKTARSIMREMIKSRAQYFGISYFTTTTNSNVYYVMIKCSLVQSSIIK